MNADLQKIRTVIDDDLKVVMERFESVLIATHLSEDDFDELVFMRSEVRREFSKLIEKARQRVRKYEPK